MLLYLQVRLYCEIKANTPLIAIYVLMRNDPVSWHVLERITGNMVIEEHTEITEILS